MLNTKQVLSKNSPIMEILTMNGIEILLLNQNQDSTDLSIFSSNLYRLT
jgi:hypothetical protein